VYSKQPPLIWIRSSVYTVICPNQLSQRRPYERRLTSTARIFRFRRPPDDPPSSLSLPQQSQDTDSPDGPALERTPPSPSVEPSSGAHLTLKSNAARDTVINLKAPKDDRERRKRNRVTPEQLVQLEAAFGQDRSPTSTERRELSNRIGMAERAVQIWFQNRSVNTSQIT